MKESESRLVIGRIRVATSSHVKAAAPQPCRLPLYRPWRERADHRGATGYGKSYQAACRTDKLRFHRKNGFNRPYSSKKNIHLSTSLFSRNERNPQSIQFLATVLFLHFHLNFYDAYYKILQYENRIYLHRNVYSVFQSMEYEFPIL